MPTKPEPPEDFSDSIKLSPAAPAACARRKSAAPFSLERQAFRKQ